MDRCTLDASHRLNTADWHVVAVGESSHVRRAIQWSRDNRLDSLSLARTFRHIANAERLPAIEVFLRDSGFAIPNVCTPEELMGDVNPTNA